MVSTTRIRTAISLIAQGLFETQESIKENPDKYPVSPLLQKGINIFLAERYFSGEVYDFKYADIHSFSQHYLTKPLQDWFSDWNHVVQKEIQNSLPLVWYLDPLARKDTDTEYACTQECYDLIDSLETNDLIGGLEQRAVYEELKRLLQKDYVDIRRFIIENPKVSSSKFRSKVREYHDNTHAKQALLKAYEEDAEKYQLLPGVKKYITDPGKYELELARFCEKIGLTWELWPSKDTFDLAITFSEDDIWTIDVKAYHNAYILENKIITDNGYPPGTYKRGFLVIPNDIIRNSPQKSNYTRIINSRCLQGQMNVTCVNLTRMKKLIQEEAKSYA